jgi:hypothetical protein
LIDDGEDDQI